jgi:hypothetical protein
VTGGWSDDDYLGTLRQFFGAGADAGQSDLVRFIRSVQSVVRKRVEVTPTDCSPAVFVLGRCPREILENTARARMLDTGATALEGAIWFVGPALGFARRLEHGCGDDWNALFGLVSDGLGVGALPAIVFLPGVSLTSVRVYPSGLEAEDDFDVLSVVHEVVTLPEVFEILDRLHSKRLITPVVQTRGNKLWKDHQKFIPVEQTELALQAYIEIALFSALANCNIKVEETAVAGRLDIAIWGLDYGDVDGSTLCYAVLELKILRSFTSGGNPVFPGEIRDWVSSGVDQAHAYALDNRALAKALCCYDMRQVLTRDECFLEVAEQAQTLGVVLRVWHLFGRLSDYRAHLREQALSSSRLQDQQ